LYDLMKVSTDCSIDLPASARGQAHGEDAERPAAGTPPARAAEVLQVAVLLLVERAEEDLLEHVEQVDRAEDDAGRGQRAQQARRRHSRQPLGKVSPAMNVPKMREELADEARQPGRPAEPIVMMRNMRRTRHLLPDAAVLASRRVWRRS
jgi:hypothetical protein